MNNFLNQLNLTPSERRVVVIIFLVVICVLNLMFVWPHFGDWGRINKQLADMRRNIDNEERTILLDNNPTNGWAKQVVKLSKMEGGSVSEHPADPQVQLQRTIQAQERKTGVYVENFNPGSVRTNAFFEEHSTTINVESQELPLVNFLYNMGMDPAMIRVSKLDLKPADANRYRLRAGITLTANYLKKPAATVETSVTGKPMPGARQPAGPGARQGPAQAGNLPVPRGPAQAQPHPITTPMVPSIPARRNANAPSPPGTKLPPTFPMPKPPAGQTNAGHK